MRHPLLEGHYAMIRLNCITSFDLARATVLSVLLLLAIGFATTSKSRTASGLQAAHEEQSGEDHRGIGYRSQGGDPGRAARSAVPEPPSMDSYAPAKCGAADDCGRPNEAVQRAATPKGGAFLRGRKIGASERGVRGPTYPSMQPMPETNWRGVALAGFVWLAILLLLRNPSVGRKLVLASLGSLMMATPAALGAVHSIPFFGQVVHASGPLPSFEAATIKPWKQPPAPPPPPPSAEGAAQPPRPAKIAPGKPGGQTSDRVRTILPARLLIAFAYNVPFGFEGKRVLGGPEWLNSDQYELEAKIEDSLYAAMQTMTSTQQREQVDLMEQSLLADRFKLKVHFETREAPGYELVVAKGGPKLTPAKEGEATRISLGGNTMTATAATLDQWVEGPFIGSSPVVNKTGLSGKYDFTLTWTNQVTADDSGTDAPSLFTAVQEQLGLKLVPAKQQLEVIVIDHIERPSEN